MGGKEIVEPDGLLVEVPEEDDVGVVLLLPVLLHGVDAADLPLVLEIVLGVHCADEVADLVLVREILGLFGDLGGGGFDARGDLLLPASLRAGGRLEVIGPFALYIPVAEINRAMVNFGAIAA